MLEALATSRNLDMAIMQKMIFDSIFEVDSVLENKCDFKSYWLHFEQNDLKYTNWVRLVFDFIFSSTSPPPLVQYFKHFKFRTKKKPTHDHFHFLDIVISWGNCC